MRDRVRHALVRDAILDSFDASTRTRRLDRGKSEASAVGGMEDGKDGLAEGANEQIKETWS